MKCPDPIAVLRKFVASFSADGQFNTHTADVPLPDLLRVAKTSLRGRKGQRVLFITPKDAEVIRLCLEGQAERLRRQVRENSIERRDPMFTDQVLDNFSRLAHRADELAAELLKQSVC